MPEKKKNVVLGITGGIAAYKAIDLASTLTKLGLNVHIVLTRNALKFVTPLTLEVITHNPVWTDDNCLQKSSIPHIKLASLADVVVVAPATANTLAKGANGLADNLLSSILLATEKKIIYVPAMNDKMYLHNSTQRNMDDVRSQGHLVMAPGEGRLACGVLGKGRYPDNRRIVTEIEMVLYGDQAMQGFSVLVTAGGTRESIDPVRFIGNRSSGKMGAALCRALHKRGAKVTLILGSNSLTEEPDGTIINVESAEQMHEQVMKHVKGVDIVIKAAAVADFKPVKVESQKIKKSVSKKELFLEETQDILRAIGQMKQERIVVGFAAETEDVAENAQKKLKEKKIDMIVANDVSKTEGGFNSENNQVIIYHRDGLAKEIKLMPKIELADIIVDEIIRMPKFGRMAKS